MLWVLRPGGTLQPRLPRKGGAGPGGSRGAVAVEAVEAVAVTVIARGAAEPPVLGATVRPAGAVTGNAHSSPESPAANPAACCAGGQPPGRGLSPPIRSAQGHALDGARWAVQYMRTPESRPGDAWRARSRRRPCRWRHADDRVLVLVATMVGSLGLIS